MKAAITKGKKEISVEELPIPELGQEEALIQVKYTGICGTDTHIYMGTFPLLNYPIVSGHEFVGKLAAIKTDKEQLKKFKIGDWVVAQPFFSCDVCDTCTKSGDHYCNDIKVHGVHINGSMAEYVKVPAKKLVKVDDNVDKKLAVLTEPLAVGVHAVEKGGLIIGNNAFVIGAGVIGIMTALAAKIAGASKVVLCDINDFRLNFAKSLGFIALDSRKPDFMKELMDLTDGKGYENVFEATGTAFGIRAMTDACKRGGIVVQLGISSECHPIHVRSFSDKEIQVRGVRIHPIWNFKAALDILERGIEKDSFMKIISNVFELDDAAKAFDFQVTDPEHFKVIVENKNM